jgi:hypothetical protein
MCGGNHTAGLNKERERCVPTRWEAHRTVPQQSVTENGSDERGDAIRAWAGLACGEVSTCVFCRSAIAPVKDVSCNSRSRVCTGPLAHPRVHVEANS